MLTESFTPPLRGLHREEKIRSNKQDKISFLLTENLINTVKQTQIETGYRSAHSFITLVFAIDNFEHGKSLCKHNNALLRIQNISK